jgi:hypothetical protein
MEVKWPIFPHSGYNLLNGLELSLAGAKFINITPISSIFMIRIKPPTSQWFMIRRIMILFKN